MGENRLLPGGDEARAERLWTGAPSASGPVTSCGCCHPGGGGGKAAGEAGRANPNGTLRACGQPSTGRGAWSVLTRLPVPSRRAPGVVLRLLAANLPENRYPSAEGAPALVSRLAGETVAGGAVYDALVGAAAAEHGLVLATRHRRAAHTSRALGVEVELLTER